MEHKPYYFLLGVQVGFFKIILPDKKFMDKPMFSVVFYTVFLHALILKFTDNSFISELNVVFLYFKNHYFRC